MAKMTWDEHEAHKAGQKALMAIRYMLDAQKRADGSKPFALSMYWGGRANKYEYEALQYAQKAARAARRGGY